MFNKLQERLNMLSSYREDIFKDANGTSGEKNYNVRDEK